jgi:hypothetical protein
MAKRAFDSAILALFLLAGANTAFGQEPLATTPSESLVDTVIETSGTETWPAIPAGTTLVIELGQTLTSHAQKRGDHFPILLAEPLLVDCAEVLPRGTRGTGQIVHAAAARGGGAPGELLISARSLETPQGPRLLRGFKLGATGEDNSGMALGVSTAIGPFAMFIRGREIEIPAGTRGIAKTKTTMAPIGGAMSPASSPANSQVQVLSASEVTHQPAPEFPGEADPAAQPVFSSQPETPAQPKE